MERLATTVFTLVHDGGPIVSLLSQIEVKNSLKFFVLWAECRVACHPLI